MFKEHKEEWLVILGILAVMLGMFLLIRYQDGDTGIAKNSITIISDTAVRSILVLLRAVFG